MMQGAIFDMDGTILDSMGVWDTVAQDYLTQLGVMLPADLLERTRPMSMQQCADYFREELGVSQTVPQIIDAVLRIMADHYCYDLPLKPQAKTLLQRLHQQGVHLCICTASDRQLAQAALSRLGVLKYFDFLMTCGEEQLNKDSPEIFERACARLGTAKTETVVFEDALHAIRTAAQAGFRVVAVHDQTAAAAKAEICKLAEQYLYRLDEFKEELA